MKNEFVSAVSEPASEPLSVDQVKLWLREDGNGQDDIIALLSRTARKMCESYTGIAPLRASYLQSADYFPVIYDDRVMLNNPVVQPAIRNYFRPFLADLNIMLMRSPLVSVTSLQYYDPSGTLQTLDSSRYVVSTSTQPGRLAPATGTTWPSTQDRPGAVLITFQAGYASIDDAPAQFKLAMLATIAHWYENRSSVMPGNLAEVPQTARALLDQIAVGWQW